MDVINQSKKLRELYQLVSTDSIKAGKTWCEFGANLVQHLMSQHPKYQTICDYTPTISHDMSVTHDIKRCETLMQKLREIIISSSFYVPEATTAFGAFLCAENDLVL